MSTNIKEFSTAVIRVSRNVAKVHLPSFKRKLVTEVLVRTVNRTPVRTGEAKGEWQVSIGAPPRGRTGRLDPGGQATLNAELAKLGEIQSFTVVFIGNNADHIVPLEHGSSKQAPTGMLGNAVREVNGLFPGARAEQFT